MRLRIFLVVFVFLSMIVNTIGQGLTIDEKVDSVLSLMTLDEKIGQMTQVERNELTNINDIADLSIGSLLSGGGSAPSSNTVEGWANMYDNFQSVALQSRLGIPLLYGVDAVHGHNNVYGTVIFPHNIGLGCTWNPELIRQVNQVTAKEVAATGIDWTFAPCIAVARNERWGRTYESFGETAEIHQLMAAESVIGLQGTNLGSDSTILACAKHFVGDGGTTDGIDQGNTEVNDAELREIHMVAYKDAISAGVGSIMASYSSWNGFKMHGHKYLLTDVLKRELGFEGFIVSDWKGVDQIDENYREAIKRAINAGIDMVMVPDRYEIFIGHLKDLVENNEVSVNRINDAVKRILKQKFLLRLFEEPYTNNAYQSSFGSQQHRDIARQAVRESMVLLNAKNDILPISRNNQKILVVGSLASDLGAQCGGWSIHWQGGNGDITKGTDILTGLQQNTGSSQIIYSETGDYENPVDVAVVIIGEKSPYAEGAGDRTSLNIDINDINLLKNLKEKGIPTVAVLISGRPLIIGDILPYTDAIMAAWLPGTEGDGVAEILFGDYNPSGKLTHSWPKNMAQVPINFGDSNYDPLFDYKHGYSCFPTRDSAENVVPYTAATNNKGDIILLSLSDSITDLTDSPENFDIFIDAVNSSENISEIRIADFDSSILLIHLNQHIEKNNYIELSYRGSGILSGNLQLDSLDKFYVHNAVGSAGEYYQVPGRIEAENYADMLGIQTETCSDVEGGLNVGYIDSGDWLKYNLEVINSGIYQITARMAGYGNGILNLEFGDTKEINISFSSTDGWQNWDDFNSQIYLEAGNYTMEAIAQTNAININYFDFSLTNGIRNPIKKINDIKVYPNPSDGELNIDFTTLDTQHITIKLIDITGSMNYTLYNGTSVQGAHNFRFNLNSDYSAGIYFIEIKDESKRYFKKVLIK